jgi:hypothetical protein
MLIATGQTPFKIGRQTLGNLSQVLIEKCVYKRFEERFVPIVRVGHCVTPSCRVVTYGSRIFLGVF